MSSKYLYLVSQWEAMTVDRRFCILAEWWPRLPPALQVAVMGLVFAVLAGELPNNAESPGTSNPVTE